MLSRHYFVQVEACFDPVEVVQYMQFGIDMYPHLFPHLISNGLDLLNHFLRILVAVDSVFSKSQRNFHDIGEIHASIVVDELPNKRMLRDYLHDLHLSVNHPRPRPYTHVNVIPSFYGVLALFLIRVTIRSILRYSYHGFNASGWQINQDHSFDRGLSCALYQPMLLELEHSKLTLVQIPYLFIRAHQSWMNSTPWEIIQDVFSNYFRQQGPEEKSSNMIQLKTGVLDPSTQIDLPG